MKYDDEKNAPRSRFLNDGSLKRLIMVNVLLLLLFSIQIPEECNFCAILVHVAMLLLAIYASIMSARSIKALDQVTGGWNRGDGLTSVVILILLWSGFTALIALDHSIPALWRLG
ncbi:hypothetical protein CWI84_02950 [Idiomarina tyrosinivorans]|uniref:Uncharacterized protein n=1 Tax=Idiomarina tyrosinivorans TaxID=1445662 RepID=A0A432ZT25_9GAMM|nr:hypothetical protein [Idiomarina tyrosinivorans]RUO81084.1 hypothetical protein CWI84_02950 [Idiomarina tyrosinivorans]